MIEYAAPPRHHRRKTTAEEWNESTALPESVPERERSVIARIARARGKRRCGQVRIDGYAAGPSSERDARRSPYRKYRPPMARARSRDHLGSRTKIDALDALGTGHGGSRFIGFHHARQNRAGSAPPSAFAAIDEALYPLFGVAQIDVPVVIEGEPAHQKKRSLGLPEPFVVFGARLREHRDRIISGWLRRVHRHAPAEGGALLIDRCGGSRAAMLARSGRVGGARARSEVQDESAMMICFWNSRRMWASAAAKRLRG